MFLCCLHYVIPHLMTVLCAVKSTNRRQGFLCRRTASMEQATELNLLWSITTFRRQLKTFAFCIFFVSCMFLFSFCANKMTTTMMMIPWYRLMIVLVMCPQSPIRWCSTNDSVTVTNRSASSARHGPVQRLVRCGGCRVGACGRTSDRRQLSPDIHHVLVVRAEGDRCPPVSAAPRHPQHAHRAGAAGVPDAEPRRLACGEVQHRAMQHAASWRRPKSDAAAAAAVNYDVVFLMSTVTASCCIAAATHRIRLRISTSHFFVIQITYILEWAGRYPPPRKLPLSFGSSGPPHDTWLLGLRVSIPQMAPWSVHLFFCSSQLWPTDRPTERPWNIVDNRLKSEYYAVQSDAAQYYHLSNTVACSALKESLILSLGHSSK